MTRSVSAAVRQRVFTFFRFRCGYCLAGQAILGPVLTIDHIIPTANGGTDDETNLCLACPTCNVYKSDHVHAEDPVTTEHVRLFNPRQDRWPEHFSWSRDGASVVGKTPIGRATVVALRMNDPACVSARALWVVAGWHPPRAD